MADTKRQRIDVGCVPFVYPTAESFAIVTADEVNALPEKVRLYIHELQTICDPAGMVREMAQLRDCNLGLQIMYRNLKDSMELKHDHNSNLAANIAAKPLEVLKHNLIDARTGLNGNSYVVLAIQKDRVTENSTKQITVASFWFDEKYPQDNARIMAEQLAAKINRQS